MIYVASKTKHAEMWKQFRAAGKPIISTWIDEAGQGQTSNLTELWERIDLEILRCSSLIMYIREDDFPLKGALVEVGMALANQCRIFVVCPTVKLEPISFRPIGSWLNHSMVSQEATLEVAFDKAIAWDASR